MFSSIDFDILAMMLAFVVMSQLCVEVVVFGWERSKRLNQMAIWADFIRTQKRFRAGLTMFGLFFLLAWFGSVILSPVETMIATAVAFVLVCVSLYFTLFDEDGHYLGAKL